MTVLLIAAILCFLAAAVMVYSAIRGGQRRERVELTIHQDFLDRYNGDRPCSRCGCDTGWSWFGRPLCTPCRKREIEGAS